MPDKRARRLAIFVIGWGWMRWRWRATRKIKEMSNLPLTLPEQSISELCRRWKIRKLALFGSVLRPDFRPDSDIDVLVVFDPDAMWSAWDHFDLREELRKLLGREIDLVEERSLENPFRRRAILRSQRVIYGNK